MIHLLSLWIFSMVRKYYYSRVEMQWNLKGQICLMIFEATQATWMVTKWRTSSVRPSERRPLDNHWMMRHFVTEMFCRVFFEMFTIYVQQNLLKYIQNLKNNHVYVVCLMVCWQSWVEALLVGEAVLKPSHHNFQWTANWCVVAMLPVPKYGQDWWKMRTDALFLIM